MNKIFKPSTSWTQSLFLFDAWTSVSLPWTSWSLKKKHRTHCHKGKEVKKMLAGNHLHTWEETRTVIVQCLAQGHNTMSQARGPFLMIAELFYSNILNMNRGFLHTSFRGIYFTGTKSLRGFRETSPRAQTRTVRSGVEWANHEATEPPTFTQSHWIVTMKSWTDLCTEPPPSHHFRGYWRSLALNRMLKLR